MKTKTKKKKLTSLLLLLFLTVVMLSVATYAWFTANKNVTVSTLDVHVDAKSGLQISANGFDWKTVLSNGDISGAITNRYTTAVNQLPNSLEPTSSAGKIDTAGGKGHMEMFHGAIGEADDSSGHYTVTATKATDTQGSTGNYIAFDLFLKTEAGGPIYLTTDSNVVKKGTEDKGLKNASRVAFVVQGHLASDQPYTSFQALNGATDSDVYIWEPNNDVHTSFAVSAAASLYGLTIAQTGEARLAYDAFKAANGTPIKLQDATVAAGSGQYVETVTPKITTPESFSLYQDMFSLSAGVTKVRVYMWIEGQDVDCENNASGTDISFNLQFSTEKPTP